MFDLLAAEFLRWRRRPEILVTFVAVTLLTAVAWLSGFSGAQSAAASGAVLGPRDVQASQSEFFLAPYRLPASIITILTSGSWLDLGLFYLAAASTGGEYGWATIRNAMLRLRRRRDYLLGRYAFLVVISLSLVLVVGLIGAVLPIAVGSADQLGPASGPAPALVIAAGGAAFVGVVLYAAAGTFLATLFRDRAAPLLIGALAVLLQSVISPLGWWAGDGPLSWIPRSFPGNALGSMFLAIERQAGFVSADAVLPHYLDAPWGISLGICAAWIVLLFVGSIWLLDHSDINE